VGDGRDAAHDGIRYLDGDLESSSDHRNYMRPGTGAYPLRGHNNVQGASDHGSMPNNLPGYQSVNDPEVRRRFETSWNVKLPTSKGLDNHEMVAPSSRASSRRCMSSAKK